MFKRLDRLGDYEITRRLRTGGMATLYLGRRLGAAGFARNVAIKVVHPHLANDETFVKMFIDEATLSARIHHPNVVHVDHFGEHEGHHFLVMEYVDGPSLGELVDRARKFKRRLSPELAIHIALKVADGLHAAHEAADEQGRLLGVVHRDVCPENVLVSHQGHVKLIDFGIAKAAGRLARTQAGVKGKYRYMSPEQVHERPLDRRSDIFALGIVLWESLTGKVLLDAESDFQIIELLRDPAFRAPSVAAIAGPVVDAVLQQALRRDPDERYPSADEFRADLATAAPRAASLAPSALAALVRAVGVGSEAPISDDASGLLALDRALDGLEKETTEPAMGPGGEPAAATQVPRAAPPDDDDGFGFDDEPTRAFVMDPATFEAALGLPGTTPSAGRGTAPGPARRTTAIQEEATRAVGAGDARANVLLGAEPTRAARPEDDIATLLQESEPAAAGVGARQIGFGDTTDPGDGDGATPVQAARESAPSLPPEHTVAIPLERRPDLAPRPDDPTGELLLTSAAASSVPSFADAAEHLAGEPSRSDATAGGDAGPPAPAEPPGALRREPTPVLVPLPPWQEEAGRSGQPRSRAGRWIWIGVAAVGAVVGGFFLGSGGGPAAAPGDAPSTAPRTAPRPTRGAAEVRPASTSAPVATATPGGGAATSAPPGTSGTPALEHASAAGADGGDASTTLPATRGTEPHAEEPPAPAGVAGAGDAPTPDGAPATGRAEHRPPRAKRPPASAPPRAYVPAGTPPTLDAPASSNAEATPAAPAPAGSNAEAAPPAPSPAPPPAPRPRPRAADAGPLLVDDEF